MKSNEIILHDAPAAKINLSLKLVGKRADGYHLLDSIFVPVPELADELTLTLHEDGKGIVSISSNLAEMMDIENNLCSKAFKLYCRLTEISPSCHIHLEKKIPSGAGVGGGSSDCAAVLKLLNSYYHKLSDLELHNGALSLGADVPFFLVGKTSRVQGIGEKIQPLGCDFHGFILLCFPPFAINTAWAFKNLDPSVIGKDPSNLTDKLSSALKNDDILTAAKCMQNDFESLLFEKFPAYKIWRNDLISLDALHVGLSGAGSTFFAVFNSTAKLQNAAAFFNQKYNSIIKTCMIKFE